MNIKQLFIMMFCCVSFYNVQAAYYMGRVLRASAGQRSKVKDYLTGYKKVYDAFGRVNHDDFGRALQEGQRLGERIADYDQALKDEEIVFDPSKSNPDEVVDALSDEKVIEMSERIEAR